MYCKTNEVLKKYCKKRKINYYEKRKWETWKWSLVIISDFDDDV